MKCFRPVLVGCVIICYVFLCGFKKPVHQHKHLNGKHQLVKAEKKQQRQLDLTVPQRTVSFEELPETLAVVQSDSLAAFSSDKKGKIRPVEFQGKVIMSSDQEAGKTKSADGAGIVINLHH